MPALHCEFCSGFSPGGMPQTRGKNVACRLPILEADTASERHRTQSTGTTFISCSGCSTKRPGVAAEGPGMRHFGTAHLDAPAGLCYSDLEGLTGCAKATGWWRVSCPHSHDLPAKVRRRLRTHGHSLALTYPALLYGEYRERYRQTERQIQVKSPPAPQRYLRNPSEATATGRSLWRLRLSEDSCPSNADPAQRHPRAHEASALTHGSEEPDSRTFRARRVNGPVSPAPRGIPKGSSVPQHTEGEGEGEGASAVLPRFLN